MKRLLKESKSFVRGGWLAAIVVCVCAHVSAGQSTYYMDTNGNDNFDGKTTSAAFATLAKFNTVAQPGDVLYIRGGTYYPPETFITRSGTSGNPITIRNYPGETPVFDGQRQNASSGTNGIVLDDGIYSGVDGAKHDLIFDGLVLRNWKRGGFYFGDSNGSRAQTYISVYNIIVRNCVIDYCGQLGIRVTHGDGIEVSNCIVSRTGWDINYGSWSSNINFFNCPGQNLVVRNCISFHAVDISSYRTDGNGMILDMYDAYNVNGGATVENCIMFENGGAGIAWTRQSNANINNNTLYNNGLEASYVYPNVGLALWREGGQGNFTNINVRNNIIWQPNSTTPAYRVLSFNGSANVDVTPASGTVTNNNITGLSGAQNPQLTDPANLDFSLTSSSPMINAGTLSNVPATSLSFNKNAIKSETSGQPHALFRWAPDVPYISNNGGVAAMFGIPARNGTPDIGAWEYTGNPPGNAMVVRARGTAGSEQIRLLLNGTAVQTWTLSTTLTDYSYTPGGAPGNTKVEFFNDASGRDVQVDYITYNGTVLQAESQASNTAVYQTRCGGSYSEWMNCNGAIDFGTLGGSSGSSTLLYSDQLDNSWYSDSWGANVNSNITSPVKVGSKSTSIQFTQAWGAWRLMRATNQSTSGFTSLKFWAYGGTGGNALQVVFKRDGNETGRKQVSVTAGTWNEYVVSLSDVGNPVDIDELWIHDGAGGAQNTFYIDQVRFANAAGREAAPLARQVKTIESGDMSIYPNPGNTTQQKISIVFAASPGKVNVQLHSAAGVKILNRQLETKSTLLEVDNVPVLPAGLYILRVRNERETWTTKYLVK